MVERKKIIEEFDILERATFGPESYIIKAIKMLVLSNERLEIAIKDSNEQSQKLEQSNYKLQWAMLILTALATAVVIYPTVKILISWSFNVVSQIIFNLLHFSLVIPNDSYLVITNIASILASVLTAISAQLATLTYWKYLRAKNKTP